MGWEAIQACAEVLAALAVLVSLGFVAVQIRHNTAAVQAGTVARTSEILNRLRTEIWTDPESARIYNLATSGVQVDDASTTTRIRLMWIALAREYEAVYYQHLSGQFPETMWESWSKEIVMILSTPGGSDALQVLRDDLLSSNFVRFLDAELGSVEQSPLLRVRAKWDQVTRQRHVDKDSDDVGGPA